MFKKNNKGIVALFPAIILSSIMLLIITTSSRAFLSMLWRENIYNEKVQSILIAKSCADRALASYVENNNYLGNETIKVGEYDCFIDPFIVNGSLISVESTVTIGDVKSSTLLDFDSTNMSIFNQRTF